MSGATQQKAGWVEQAKGRGGFKRPPPKNGQAYVGALIGGYQQTRNEIARELLKTYAIDCRHKFGKEMTKHPGELFIPAGTEIVVLLADDIEPMLQKVLRACEKAKIEHVGINRKQHTWEPTFKMAGFPPNPSWRNGFDIDKVDPLKLDAIEAPRLAYEDPALKAARMAKIADVAPPVIKLVQQLEPPKPKPPSFPKKDDGTVPPQVFADALRKLRAESGHSQRTLGAEMTKHGVVSVAQGVISKWEHASAPSMPLYGYWVALKKIFPTLPKPSTMLGEKIYLKRQADLAKQQKKVAKPAPEPVKAPEPAPAPVVAEAPPTPPAAPEPPPAPPPAPVVAPERLVVTTASVPTQARASAPLLQEYMAALHDLQVFDEAMQRQRDELIARIDAIHAKVTGRQ